MSDQKSILVVEDEFHLRDFYSQKLQEAGYKITLAVNGEEAIQKLQEERYDLVLLDILMPKLNGIEVLKQMKENENWKDIPVYLLTNLGQDELIKQGFQLGAQGYLIKTTFTIDQILGEVKEFFVKNEKGEL